MLLFLEEEGRVLVESGREGRARRQCCRGHPHARRRRPRRPASNADVPRSPGSAGRVRERPLPVGLQLAEPVSHCLPALQAPVSCDAETMSAAMCSRG